MSLPVISDYPPPPSTVFYTQQLLNKHLLKGTMSSQGVCLLPHTILARSFSDYISTCSNQPSCPEGQRTSKREAVRPPIPSGDLVGDALAWAWAGTSLFGQSRVWSRICDCRLCGPGPWFLPFLFLFNLEDNRFTMLSWLLPHNLVPS